MIYVLDQSFLESSSHRRRVLAAIGMGFLFFIASFIAFKLYFILFWTTAKPRTELTHQPFHKLYWFLRIELPLSLNFWHLMDSSKRALTLGVAAGSLALIVVGNIAGSVREIRSSVADSENPSKPRGRWIASGLVGDDAAANACPLAGNRVESSELSGYRPPRGCLVVDRCLLVSFSIAAKSYRR